jgi:predicted branched-subunit amino acid permease
MASHLTFRQGVKECVPTLLGYAGVGLSFGIVAVASKFSLIEIILLCLLVYAGAAQFIICSLVIDCWYTYHCNCANDFYS